MATKVIWANDSELNLWTKLCIFNSNVKSVLLEWLWDMADSCQGCNEEVTGICKPMPEKDSLDVLAKQDI